MPSPPRPFISVVIPTYNRPTLLATCLDALARVDYPRDRFEVIVVDDGSPLSLAPTVAPFETHFAVSLVRQANTGPSIARNTGAARARGSYLAFTDDDCRPTPTWLHAIADRILTHPASIIGGRILNSLPGNPYSAASQLLVTYLYAYYNTNPTQARFFNTSNLTAPADRFHTLGGFDPVFPRFAEDRDLCDRWLLHGYQMVYAPEVVVDHAHHLTLRSFWLQHFCYGQGAYDFHRARARRRQARVKVEPLSFYLNLLLSPWRQPHASPRPALAALLALSQVANVTGYFSARARHTLRAL
jgi:GT2 family glycosyltransferase